MAMVVVALLAVTKLASVVDDNQIDLKTDQARRKAQAGAKGLCYLAHWAPDRRYSFLHLLRSLLQPSSERVDEDRATGSSARIQETYAGNFPVCCAWAEDKLQQNIAHRRLHGDFFLHVLFLLSISQAPLPISLSTRPLTLSLPQLITLSAPGCRVNQ